MEKLTEIDYQMLDIVSGSSLNYGTLTFDSDNYRVATKEKDLFLGRRQFALLLLLAKNSGRILSKEQLYTQVWNDHVPINVDETIRYHISEIRKKLDSLAVVDCIETVWGIGYRFRKIIDED